MQDAGGIIERIVDLRKNLRTKLEFMHCKGNVQRPDKFEDNPIVYIMNLCDEKSKKVRKEVAKINRRKDLEVLIENQIEVERQLNYRVAQEIVRTTDSMKDFKEHAHQKFGENYDLVDVKVRRVLNGGGTLAQIKCALGINPCGAREKIMSKSKSDKCPVYGNIED